MERNDLRSAPGRSCFFFYLATGTGSVQVVSLASRTFEGRYHYSPSVTELGFHCFCWWFFLVPGENQKSSPPTVPPPLPPSPPLSIEPREFVYRSSVYSNPTKFIGFFFYFCLHYRDIIIYISFPSYFCFMQFKLFLPWLTDFIIKKVYSGRDWIRANWENQIFVYWERKRLEIEIFLERSLRKTIRSL